MKASDLLTIKQVGELVGLESQPAIHAWLKKNAVAKQKDGARTYIRKSDVLVAMEKGKVAAAEKKAEAEVKPDDPDLISMTEAADLVGRKKGASMHGWLKDHDIPRTKVGGRVYVSKERVLEAKDEAVVRAPKVKVEKPNPFKPFETKPELVLWNKGLYRGWAVAAVADTSPSTVTMLTDYGKTYLWPHVSVAKDIAEGKFFYAEPAEVLKFLAVQLLRVKDAHCELPGLIKRMAALAEELGAVKLDLTRVAKPETVEEVIDVDDVEDDGTAVAEEESDSSED